MTQLSLINPVANRIPFGQFSRCEEHDGCEEPYCVARRYRYVLQYPTGLDDSRICLFVLANPSTATPDELDPTLIRCRNFARDWGYGLMHVVNVRAWRETDPDLVPGDPLAIGPYNDAIIAAEVSDAHLVVCGWGKLGGQRGLDVLQLIRTVGKTPHALRLNKDGSPRHPLYLSGDARPFAMGAHGQLKNDLDRRLHGG